MIIYLESEVAFTGSFTIIKFMNSCGELFIFTCVCLEIRLNQKHASSPLDFLNYTSIAFSAEQLELSLWIYVNWDNLFSGKNGFEDVPIREKFHFLPT